jgi:hypothetical protein
MGTIGTDMILPGNPTQTIRLDNNPDTFDTSIYNTVTFNNIIDGIKNIIPAYSTQLSEYSYLFELYTKYDDENERYDTNTKKEFTDILKNERNTYYQDQGIDSLHYYYCWLLVVYIITVIVFVVSIFVFPSDWSIMKKMIVLLVLVMLPFGSSYIMSIIIRLLHGTYNLLPKNVYLHA